MRPYALIDLHCDTLTDCMYAGSNIIDTLDDPARTLSLTSIPKDIHWAQFFAVFVPDELRGEKAIRFFDDACANFDRQMRKFADRVSPCRNVADMERAWAAGKTAAFLSVENGSAFAGDLSRIGKTKRQGVCAVTLTWNGENEIGARKNLALGSDFDGAVLPPCLDSPEKAADFYEYLLSRGVSQQDADGIFFENARTFLRKNLG